MWLKSPMKKVKKQGCCVWKHASIKLITIKDQKSHVHQNKELCASVMNCAIKYVFENSYFTSQFLDLFEHY